MGAPLVPVLTGQNAPAPRKFVRAEFYDTLEVDMNYDGLRAPGEIQAAGKPAESCYATMYYDGRFKLSVYHGIQFRRVVRHGKRSAGTAQFMV